jgi:ATP-dependent helicase/DNAse subunit B
VPLHLVAGPANAAKAGEVFARYRAALAAGRAPVLVVPTSADVTFYSRELAEGETVLGARIVPFTGLLRLVADRLELAGRPLGPHARERVVARTVARVELDALAASAASPGFRRALTDLVAELGAEDVDPPALAGVLAAHGRTGREVARLYAAYRGTLGELRREDEERFAWRTARAIRERPAAWAAVPVFLYGFDDLTSLQAYTVEALATAAGAEVTVSLPFEAREAFAGRARTWQELGRVAGENVVHLAAREDFYADGSRPALHHLERGLWDPEAEPFPGDGDGAVRLLESAGERAEAEALALEVLRLGAERGIPPGEIALVFRRPEASAALAERVFAAAGVPLAGEHRLPVVRAPLGRGLLGMLRAAFDPDAAAGELMLWLRTPGQVRRPELVDRLESACALEGLATAAAARERWEADNPTWRLTELDRLAAAAEAGPRAVVSAARAAAERLWAAPHRKAAPVLDPARRAGARVLAAVLGALAEIEDGGGATPAELIDVVEGLEARVGDPSRPGAVTLSDPLGIRARRFRAVLVAGLQEGEFPAPPRPEPLLGDEARGELAGRGVPLRREAHTPDEERYLLYACASRASEVLVLSSRTADEEGNPALASAFVEEVRRLFPGLVPVKRTLADVLWPPGRGADRGAAPVEAPLGDITQPEVRALLRHQQVLSAGALETYVSCPVHWLVDKEISPSGLEPDSDALARGSYIHRVLQAVHAELRARTGTGRLTLENRAEAERLLLAALDAERPGLDAELPPLAAESAARGAAIDLRRYLAQSLVTRRSAFEPAFFELRFGFEDGEPPLVVGEGDDAIRVRGAIDRVDVDGQGRAMVWDYKSGAPRSEMAVANWLEHGQLQVALYLLAVRDLLGLIPAGGLYQPLRPTRNGDRRPRGALLDLEEFEDTDAYCSTDVLEPEAFAAELAAVEEEVVLVARRLRAGELTASPSTCDWRGRCAFPGICRVGE